MALGKTVDRKWAREDQAYRAPKRISDLISLKGAAARHQSAALVMLLSQ
jgi:hypothetical protein